MIATQTKILPFHPDQHREVLAFVEQQSRIHMHLDWRSVREWLRDETRLVFVAMHRDQLRGVIAYSQPHHQHVWVRLMTLSDDEPLSLFQDLLDSTIPDLTARGITSISLLQLSTWMVQPLQASPFERITHLVHLERPPHTPTERPPADFSVHQVRRDDLDIVRTLDHAAFDPIWQMKADDLDAAYYYASHFTVAVQDDYSVGYQLSTSYPDSLHLARLAVHPAYQGQGIASQLLYDLVETYPSLSVTVNTQANNVASRRVYERVGFVERSLITPVWAYRLESNVNGDGQR